MAVRVAKLHGDLHAGPPPAVEIDRNIVLAQMRAGVDNFIQRCHLKGHMVQTGAGAGWPLSP